VLPLPNLGTMKFLSALLLKAPPTVFDNEAMGLVLRVMWQNHIRKYFIVDTIIFLLYFILWIILVDSTSASSTELSSVSVPQRVVAVIIMVLNSVYTAKELIQSDLGRRSGYFWSLYNYVDILSIIFVYAYTIPAGLRGGVGEGLVPLAVLTTLLLTTVRTASTSPPSAFSIPSILTQHYLACRNSFHTFERSMIQVSSKDWWQIPL
jgi:hypothetical protein